MPSLAFKSFAKPKFSNCKSVYLQAFQMAKCPRVDYRALSFTMDSTHWWQGSIVIIITGGLIPPNAGSKTTSWQTTRVKLCERPPPNSTPPSATRTTFVPKKGKKVKRSLYQKDFTTIHEEKFRLHSLTAKDLQLTEITWSRMLHILVLTKTRTCKI